MLLSAWLRRTLHRSVILFSNIEPLRGSDYIVLFVPRVSPGAIYILPLRGRTIFCCFACSNSDFLYVLYIEPLRGSDYIVLFVPRVSPGAIDILPLRGRTIFCYFAYSNSDFHYVLYIEPLRGSEHIFFFSGFHPELLIFYPFGVELLIAVLLTAIINDFMT